MSCLSDPLSIPLAVSFPKSVHTVCIMFCQQPHLHVPLICFTSHALLTGYIGDDYPAQIPLKLPSVGLALEYGEPNFSLLADDEWGTQFPPSDGFTDIGNRAFLISMVHQMHCLDVIRVGFVTNRTGSAHHIEHCLRYLRQIVLCYADATLEPSQPALSADGVLLHQANGVGSIHRCKDWRALRKYMEEYPARDPEPL